jgi:hypothetical protein
MDTISRAEAERSEIWLTSVRTYTSRRQEQNRWEWVRYFDRMARIHGQLSEGYTARADAIVKDFHDLCSEEGEL